MMFALDDMWLWDQWYVHDGSRWHGYFLQAPRALGNAELRHWNVSILHAVSDDFLAWEQVGPCLSPAEAGFDDCTTWTGSVVGGDDGLWHLFYTGTSHAERGLHQRIGHAVSDDLHHWQDRRCILDRADPYEEHDPARWHDRAFRDPWVFRDPDGDGWLMAFTARDARAEETKQAGCIGLARSRDLRDWTLEPPLFTGFFGELEVPQVFEADGRWYCLFCTAAHHWSGPARDALGTPMTGTHYLVADHPRGPWQLAPAPLLDMHPHPFRYAGRIVDAGGLKLTGFRWFDEPGAPFAGRIDTPQPVAVGADGLLRRV